MPMFHKKPKLVEAEQFFHDKSPLPFADRGAVCFDGNVWYVITAHGHKTPIVDGDWIVPEPDGRGFYPIKDDIFVKDHTLAVPKQKTLLQEVLDCKDGKNG